MQLPKPTEGGHFELTPAGTFVGTCYRFIDLGTQQNEYMGEKKIRHTVMITWELTDELMQDGRPFSVSKTYSWSMHEKATLRKDLEAWRGRAFDDGDFEGPNAFDTRNLLGKSCMLTITHTAKGDKTYSNISSIGKLMKGLQPSPMFNKAQYLALVPDRYDASIYGGLSDNLKAKIASSPEYQEIVAASARHDDPGSGYDAGADQSDEIPF